MHKGFFVTGTDTDIGKTFVSRLLVQGLMKIAPTTYMKPVQTGCIRGETVLAAPDFDYVADLPNVVVADYQTHVPYRFELPASPHLAAAQEHARVALPPVLDAFRRLSDEREIVVVEGAGGVFVPLNDNEMMLDLMKALRLPVVLVTSPRLGTLNHTLLTLHALASRDLFVAGVVYNNQDQDTRNPIYQDNKEVIRHHARASAFLEISPHQVLNESIVEFCREISSIA